MSDTAATYTQSQLSAPGVTPAQVNTAPTAPPNSMPATPPLRPLLAARSAADILATMYPPIEYTVDGLFPVGLAVLAGSAKIGKSWMLLQLAQAVATGTPFLGQQTRRGRVLYLALEDNEARIQRRLRLQGATPADLKNVMIATRFDGTYDELCEAVAAWAAEDHEAPPALVIIDTLGRVMRGRDSNTDDYSHTVHELEKLQRVAFEYGLSVVVAHHKRKAHQNGGGGDPFEEMMGSTAIGATADASILLDKKRLSSDGTIQTMSRDAEEQLIDVTFDKTSFLWFPRAADPIAQLGVKGRVADVVAAIGDKTVTAKDLQRELSMRPNQLSDLITDGEHAGVFKREGKGVYRLSDNALDVVREAGGAASMATELNEPPEHDEATPEDTDDTHPGFEF